MLRLKEKPSEWIKFTMVMGVVANAILWTLWYKKRVPTVVPTVAAGVAVLTIVMAFIRPVWFRGFYRGGMTVSFHVGQTVGKVLLTLFFFLLVTPLGWLLRLAGKDLLQIRRQSEAQTWWHEAKDSREFDRMF